MQRYAPAILRIGLSLVFLWFGSSQLMDPAGWASIVPEWGSAPFGGDAQTVVILNGWFEIVAGLMLLAGFQVRLASLLLALHLVGIASSFGLSPIGVRDFGLAIATFSVFLAGADVWSADHKLAARSATEVPTP